MADQLPGKGICLAQVTGIGGIVFASAAPAGQ
jgi:hypothetical protein